MKFIFFGIAQTSCLADRKQMFFFAVWSLTS